MPKILKKKACFFAFILSVFIIGAVSNIQAAYVISSLDFQISPASNKAKIGDNILINMAVIDVTQTYSNVSVAASGSTASVTVTSSVFPGTFTSAFYVYDGTRTWRINASDYVSAAKWAVIGNGNLIAGRTVSDYNTLAYASFSSAAGSLEPGGSASIDIGTAVKGIKLFDDGDSVTHNDAAGSDGIYNTMFEVREAYRFNILNGSIAGQFKAADNSNASNAPFIAPRKISIDGVRPTIELVDARPNPFNPNKELLKMNYLTTEDCSVALTVKNSSATQVKYIELEGTGNALELYLWDGLSDAGIIQTDGDYKYIFEITDEAGNTGPAYTGDIKITTVEVVVEIQTIDTHFTPTEESQVEVNVIVTTELRNATSANLANLGFDASVWGAGHYKLWPWVLIDLKLYDSAGNLLSDFPKDTTDFDEDYIYINPAFDPMYATNPDFDYPNGYDPAYPEYCSETALPFIHTDPDGDTGNDWNTAFGNSLTAVGVGLYRKKDSFVYHSGDINASGTYLVKSIGMLVGKSVLRTNEEIIEVTDNCTEETLFINNYHAQPSFFRDETTGIISDFRGYGIASAQRTAMFVVEEGGGVPTPDNDGPIIVPYSEYPSNGQILKPEKIGPSNYLKVMLTDEGVGAGYVNLSGFELLDPYGNPVSGQVAWNAGTPDTKTWEVYFIPDEKLTTGGTYEYTVIPKDGAGNAGETAVYTFVVTDLATPVVTDVSVYSASNSNESLSPSTSTQVTFQVSRIEATIIPGGTVAAVDWNATTITVKNSANQLVSGVVFHDPGTNVLLFTPNTSLSDGSYTVNITAYSDAGESIGYSYQFYVTTAGISYVNISGTTTEGTDTYMIISLLQPGSTGIVESAASREISPTAIDVAEVAAGSIQTPPSNRAVFGAVVEFSVSNPNSPPETEYQLPLVFNPVYCEVTLRMHFSDTQLGSLLGMGLDADDLSLYKYDGAAWTQMSGAGSVVSNGADNYIEVVLTEGTTPENLPLGNQYALMYNPPAESTAAFHFDNTKAFDPKTGSAKLFYSEDTAISEISDVEVYIFSIKGSLIRKLEMLDPAETALFSNYESDPANASNVNYYVEWDGRNDNGSLVRNGVYAVKIIISKSDGSKRMFSRLIAVLK